MNEEPTAWQYIIEGIPAIIRLRIKLWLEDLEKWFDDNWGYATLRD